MQTRSISKLNHLIKESIKESDSNQVFDALNTLTKGEMESIKRQINFQNNQKALNNFEKLYTQYQYALFEYVFKSYDHSYHTQKEHTNQLWPLFLPNSLNTLKNRKSIVQASQNIIHKHYHFTKEQTKDLSSILKYSGLPQEYKKDVYDKISELLKKHPELNSPENAENINNLLVTQSYKNSSRAKIKEYLNYNGEEIVEDFFETDRAFIIEEEDEVTKERAKSQFIYRLDEENLLLCFTNQKGHSIQYKDFETQEFLENKDKFFYLKNDEFVLDSLITPNDIDSYFFNIENNQYPEIALFNYSTGRCIYFKSITKDDFFINDNQEKELKITSKLIKKGTYIIVINPKGKFKEISCEQDILEDYNHPFLNKYQLKGYSINLNSTCDLYFMDGYVLNIAPEEKLNADVSVKGKTFKTYDEKYIYQGDLFIYPEIDLDLDLNNISVEINNSKIAFKNDHFTIKEEQLNFETGLHLLPIKIYYKNKKLKNKDILYAKGLKEEQTINGIEFDGPINDSNLQVHNGEISNDKTMINIFSNQQSMVIYTFRKNQFNKNVSKIFNIKNKKPIIKKRNKDNCNYILEGIEYYQFDPEISDYQIWLPDENKAALKHYTSSNPTIKPLKENTNHHINYRDYKNDLTLEHNDREITLFSQSNLIQYLKHKKAYQFKGCFGDEFLKLTQIGVLNGKATIKEQYSHPDVGQQCELIESINDSDRFDYYLSLLEVSNYSKNKTYNSLPLLYNIWLNNTTSVENSDFKQYFSKLIHNNLNNEQNDLLYYYSEIFGKNLQKKNVIDFAKYKQYNSLTHNSTLINSFNNMNLFKNYGHHLKGDFLKVFNANTRGYYFDESYFNNLNRLTSKTSLENSKTKTVSPEYLKSLIRYYGGNFISMPNEIFIQEENFDRLFWHLFIICQNETENEEMKNLLKETIFLVDVLLEHDIQIFERNIKRLPNLDIIVKDYYELFEILFILGKLLRKGEENE